jgi:hypothetical protein
MDKKVYVVSTGAYSFTRQTRLLASVLNGYAYMRNAVPCGNVDVLIILGNINIIPISIPYHTSFKKLIIYTVIEGDFPPNPAKNLIKRYNPTVIVPNNYVKSLLEKYDIKVDGIIPHGIEYKALYSIPNKDIDYLYIAEYQKRKMPDGGLKVLKALQDKLALVSDYRNPYIRQLKPKIKFQNIKSSVALGIPYATDNIIYDLYKRTKFYLNVSANEGFGLTPLEAEAFGDIPITPRLPPFKDTLGNCPYFLDINENDYDLWNYGELKLYLYRYDANKLIELAKNSVYDTNRAMECIENAKKFYYKDVYQKFYEYL